LLGDLASICACDSTLSGMHDDQKVGSRVHAACIRRLSGKPRKVSLAPPFADKNFTQTINLNS